MKWYELKPKQRYLEVYSKYSIDDFYNWWSDEQNDYMELRFDTWEFAVEAREKFFVSGNKSSVYTNNPEKIGKIINHFRSKSTIWFGINPKKKVLNERGKLTFTGKDIGITKNKFLFIDIDRKLKEGPATNKDLMDINYLADTLLEELSKEGFNNNYCKICSGNGLQLLIKLDVPIHMIDLEFNAETKSYNITTLFEEQKNIIKNGIGKILPKFSKKFDANINAEIDDKCFNIGRVGALPYSFNLKYKNPIPRGIVELVNKGKNDGLTEYLKDLYEKKKDKTTIKNNYTEIKPVQITTKYLIEQNNFDKNNLINLMLTHEFPAGGINNTLWYSIKILMHNNSITNNDSEYKNILNKLRSIHKRTFTDNGLEQMYKDNYSGPITKDSINMVPFIVNKYLRTNKIIRLKDGLEYYHPPIFSVTPKGKIKYDLYINNVVNIKQKNNNKEIVLSQDKTDFLTDLKILKNKIYDIRAGEGEYYKYMDAPFKYTTYGLCIIQKHLTELIEQFLYEIKNKWGDELTNYIKQFYLNNYVNYKTI